MSELIIAAILCVIVYIIITVIFFYERKVLMKIWQQDREMWSNERQKLLDRIQAPSFEVYKHAEIVRAKVDKQETKPDNQIEEV